MTANPRKALREFVEESARRYTLRDPDLEMYLDAPNSADHVQLAMRQQIKNKCLDLIERMEDEAAITRDTLNTFLEVDPYLPAGGNSDFEIAVSRGVAAAINQRINQRKEKTPNG
ncbi:MAG: hypothetical protein ACO23F_05755 [Candidatus Limnocylindrus sp.]